MKFCHLLRSTAQHLPDVRQLSEQYKRQKKQIRRAHGVLSDGNFAGWNAFEAQFADALARHLAALNETFVEREEGIVMRLAALEEEAAGIATAEGCALLIRRCVDFHGELVLFMHWSMLAYTGMAKILKKHLKKTGGTVPSVPMEALAKQPFFSPEVCCSWVHRTEDAISHLQQLQAQLSAGMGDGEHCAEEPRGQHPCQEDEVLAQVYKNIEEIGGDRGLAPAAVLQQTQVALATWEHLKSSAVTPSTVLHYSGHETASHSSSISQNEMDES